MIVLIAGITGNLGQPLATEALSRGLSVRGLGRDPSKLPASLSSALESFVVSKDYYDIPALEKAVSGVGAVICAYAPTPTMDLDAHLLLLRAAERAGVTVFVASCWNNDWSKMEFGDFEHYDTHISFERHVAMTSPIRPVYIFTGMFGDLVYTPFNPGCFEVIDGTPTITYWGDADKYKFPWTAHEDVAAYTIEILLDGQGVQDGLGGFFRVKSGEHTFHEFAAAYEEVMGDKVRVIKRGTEEQLDELLAKERRTKGRSHYMEYISLAAAKAGSKGSWAYDSYTDLSHVRQPLPLQDLVRRQFGKT